MCVCVLYVVGVSFTPLLPSCAVGREGKGWGKEVGENGGGEDPS